jgi:arginase
MAIWSVPYFMGDAMPGFEVPEPHGMVTPELPGDGNPQERMAVLYGTLADHIADDDFPIVYAGDCVSVIGVLAGLQQCGVDPLLIWLDAHGDFNTGETTPSGFLGGMPLAMLTGRGEQTIVTGAGLRPLPDEQVILVDARDLDPGEDEAVAASGIVVVSVDRLAHTLPPDAPIYVHVDVDVVTPDDLPAVNYPARDGPSLAQVRAAMINLAATGRVAAVSISGWNPELPGADIAAAATYQLVAPFLADLPS